MIRVLYEDNHLLVCDKPPALLTQDSGTGAENLEDQAKAWLKEKYQKPGAVYLHAVHRLDRQVSGIVLFAKTSKALKRLQEAMRKREIEKVYHARVEGSLTPPEGRLDHHWIHQSHRADVHLAPFPGSKPVGLRYKTLGDGRIELTLETGRYHQIRAQLACAGVPILGDKKYGAQETYRGKGIALRHVRMTLKHPVGAERMEFLALDLT